MKPCICCSGVGTTILEGFTSTEGKVYPTRTITCTSCNGEKNFPEVEESFIRALLIAGKGKNKGKIRAAMTSPSKNDGVMAARAYYVWRLARFHGGVDVTLPVTAEFVVRGDPYRNELEKLACKYASEFFGSEMKGAARWAKAFGII